MTPPPVPRLASVPLIHTRDLDLARQLLRRVLGEYTVDLPRAEPGGFEWRAGVTDLGPLAIMKSTTRGGVRTHGVSRGYALNLADGAGVQATVGGDRVDVACGKNGAIASPDTSVTWAYEGAAMTSTTVRIDARFVESELEALTGRAVRALVFAPRVRLDHGPGATLTRMCAFLLAELAEGAESFAHPLVTSNLCQALVRQLLFGQPHDHGHLLEKPAPPSSRSVVRFVEEYLEAHAGEPVRVADLAALTGASVRAIEAAFRAQRGTTPGAFLRDKRLSLARRRLGEPGVTVTHAAYASGFLRRGRFEQSYLETFGETPQATRRRAIAAAPPAPPADSAREALSALSPRELEVCLGVARGLLNKQIAAELGITEGTVKAHRGRAMARLGMRSAAELGRLLERVVGGASER